MEICPFSKLPCKYKKILHITELEKGSLTEKHLCEQCVEGYSPEKPKSNLLSLLTLLVGVQPKKEVVFCPKVQCPGCGITPAEISQTGRFGCSQCYEYYFSPANAIIARVQDGATAHIGKKPRNAPATQDILAQIRNLELKMANAVKVENYEIAGMLKAKIEELKKPL